MRPSPKKNFARPPLVKNYNNGLLLLLLSPSTNIPLLREKVARIMADDVSESAGTHDSLQAPVEAWSLHGHC